jgi:3-hydroxyacyl-CoA dehydrogenase
VVLCDVSAAALKNARKSINSMLLAAVTRKLITAAMMKAMMSQLSSSANFGRYRYGI